MRFALGSDDRPWAVAWYEWLSILFLAYDCIVSQGPPWFAVTYAIVMLRIIVAISRQRSRAARWLLSALVGIQYAAILVLTATGRAEMAEFSELEAIDWAPWVFSVVTLFLLWSRPMSDWISSRPGVGTRSAV